MGPDIKEEVDALFGVLNFSPAELEWLADAVELSAEDRPSGILAAHIDDTARARALGAELRRRAMLLRA